MRESLVIFGILIHLIICNSISLAEDPEIAVWEAAIDEYIQKANFHSDFTFKEGTTTSVEAGLKGEFRDVEIDAKGTLTKMGSKVRFSLDYGKAPIRTGPNTTSNRSPDEMSDGKVFVRSELRFANPTDWIEVGLLSNGKPPRIPSDGRCLTPLNLTGGEVKNALQNPCPDCAPSDQFTRKVITQDDKVVEVETALQGDGFVDRRRIFIDYSFDPAVIRSIVLTSESGGKVVVYLQYQASEFVKIGTVMMPKIIRMGVRSDKRQFPGFREWRATEMRLPRESDFIMSVKAGRRIIGLRAPVDLKKPTVLDLSKLSPETLADPIAMQAILEQRPNEISGGTIVIWVAVVVALIGFSSFAFWRFRR